MDCYFNTALGLKKIKAKMWLDTEAEGKDTIYCLKFPYFKPMVEFVKDLDRPLTNSFDPKTKIWRIKNNRRNLFCLNLITKNDMIQKFIRPLGNKIFEGNWIHQNEMENAIETRKTLIIAGQMRTGKTKPTLNCIKKFAKGQVWIISSRNALKSVKREVIKWGINNSNIRFFTYDGFRMHIQEMDSLNFNNEYLDTGSFIDKDTIPNFVIFDEMHHLKSPTTQTSQAAMLLSQWMHEIYGWDNYYLVGLSGTPAPLNPGDWWSLVEIICPGFIKEPSRAKFERRMSKQELRTSNIGQQYWHFLEWDKEEVEKLYRRLKPIVFTYLKSEVLDLPPIEYEIVELKPSKEILRTSRLISKSETNALVAVSKLRQLSDGFMYKSEYDPELNIKKRTGIDFVGSPKVEQLKEDLDEYETAAENGTGRLVINAGYQGSIDIITNICLEKEWVVLRIDGRGSEVFTPDNEEGQPYHTTLGLDTRIDPDFCLNEMDRSTDKSLITKLAIVSNPDAGGEGGEYSAAPVIIYYSNPNKGKARMQSEARAHSDNMDKAKGLLIKDYCHLPSDYKILKSLKEKEDLQNISMGELNSILNMDSNFMSEFNNNYRI